jgi:hypothetical protein
MDTETGEAGGTIHLIHEARKSKGRQAVAIWLGVKLELPSGRNFAILMCSEEQNGGMLFVEGVQGPSDEDEDMIQCSICDAPHYVLSFADAIEEELVNVEEAVGCLPVSKIVGLTIRDLEAAVRERKEEAVKQGGERMAS